MNYEIFYAFPEWLDVTEQGKQFTGLERIQDDPTETAKNFRIDGHRGTVSFITSMTEHFCAGCNRLRLLADGNFKVCLFGPSEVKICLDYHTLTSFRCIHEVHLSWDAQKLAPIVTRHTPEQSGLSI